MTNRADLEALAGIYEVRCTTIRDWIVERMRQAAATKGETHDR